MQSISLLFAANYANRTNRTQKQYTGMNVICSRRAMLSGYLWDTGAGLSRDSIDGVSGTVTAPGDYQVLDITASHTLSPEIENCTH